MTKFAYTFNSEAQFNSAKTSLIMIIGYFFIMGGFSRLTRTFLPVGEIAFTRAEELAAIFLFAVSLYIVIAAFICIYNITLISITMRFKMINENLSENRLNLRLFAELHIKLCDAINKINQIFSTPLRNFLSFALISMIFSLYELYFSIKSQANDPHQLGLCLITNTWNICIIPGLFITFNTCESLRKEGNLNSTKILHEMMRSERDDHVKARIIYFIYQFEHSNVSLSTGMYDFDWKIFMFVSFL